MPFRDPFPDKLDHLLSCARIVAPLVPEIEAAKAQVASLQRELESVGGEIAFIQTQLVDERKSFDAEKRRSLDARRHDWLVGDQEERDLASALADAKAKLRSMQDKIAARREEFEALAKQVNRMERYHPTYPTS
jgi:predicted  nucleic acid-binding Zn-ribbon protein